MLKFRAVRKPLVNVLLSRTCSGHSSSSESSSDSSSDEETPFEERKLYETHIPTSLFQKSLLAVGSAITALGNPWRDGMAEYAKSQSGFS